MHVIVACPNCLKANELFLAYGFNTHTHAHAHTNKSAFPSSNGVHFISFLFRSFPIFCAFLSLHVLHMPQLNHSDGCSRWNNNKNRPTYKLHKCSNWNSISSVFKTTKIGLWWKQSIMNESCLAWCLCPSLTLFVLVFNNKSGLKTHYFTLLFAWLLFRFCFVRFCSNFLIVAIISNRHFTTHSFTILIYWNLKFPEVFNWFVISDVCYFTSRFPLSFPFIYLIAGIVFFRRFVTAVAKLMEKVSW